MKILFFSVCVIVILSGCRLFESDSSKIDRLQKLIEKQERKLKD